MAVTDIKGFLRVDERVGTAGQPTERQVEEIAAERYEVVINLGIKDPRYCLEDEARSVAAAGMSYEHIPVNFEQPTAEDFRAFHAAMTKYEAKRVFVHCAANYRVSSFMALYGEAELGWSRSQADDWATRLWQPNETWTRFLEERRRELFGGTSTG
jgi:protein tyrosine phosphatase (PTP) superfamily phosphohydrolase (DUF442 family)